MSELGGKRVLVTGGAGFIGSHLVDALLARGAHVRVFDNFSTGHRSNLAHCQNDIELIEGDLRDFDECVRACATMTLILHQGALGSVPKSMKAPATSIAVNAAGTANLFAAARDAEIARVVYASSSSVYGDSENQPKREGEEGEPLSPYALSKVMCEQLARTYARCYALDLIGLRYFNVYGPRQDPNGPYAAVVPRFFAACANNEPPVIFGDGQQSRDFTFVADTVTAILTAAVAPLTGAHVFNVGCGATTTVQDLAETICSITGVGVTPVHTDERPGDVRHSLADIARARDELGFVATTNLEQGLRQVAAAETQA